MTDGLDITLQNGVGGIPGENPLQAQTKKELRSTTTTPFDSLAEGPGFEPGLTESESVVLPLDDPPVGYGIV